MDLRLDDPLHCFSLHVESTMLFDKYPELTYVSSLRFNAASQLDEYLNCYAATGIGGIPEVDAFFEMEYCSLANGLLREGHSYGTGAYVFVYGAGAGLASIGFVIENRRLVVKESEAWMG